MTEKEEARSLILMMRGHRSELDPMALEEFDKAHNIVSAVLETLDDTRESNGGVLLALMEFQMERNLFG